MIEMIQSSVGEWKMLAPQLLNGVLPYIPAPRRADGTTNGMQEVEGMYLVEGQEKRITKVYDVKTQQEAIDKAKTDGLTFGYIVSTIGPKLNIHRIKN